MKFFVPISKFAYQSSYLRHLLETKLNQIENSYAEYTNKSANYLDGGCQHLVQQEICLVSISVLILQEW
jgi:hypothetical protein